MNKIVNIDFQSITDQGMRIEEMTLKLLNNRRHNIVVKVSEQGFPDLWTYRIFLTKKEIIFDHGHFWLKRFFNPTVTARFCQMVKDYEYTPLL